MSDDVARISDDPLATIKRRPSIRDVKDSEVLWLVAEVDELRAEVARLRGALEQLGDVATAHGTYAWGFRQGVAFEKARSRTMRP